MRLAIKRQELHQIIDQACQGYPYEVCGLVGGRNSGSDNLTAESVTSVANVSPQPRTGYEMDRRAMVEAILAIQRAGREVVAIYHSHPDVAPIPSKVDIAQASWPDVAWIIVGVSAAGSTEIRAWTIRSGKVAAAELEVVES